MTQPENVEALRARWDAEQRRWDRKFQRMRRLAIAFLIPYALAGGVAGVILARMGETRSAIGLAACFAVIVSSQWTQPYLQRRGDRKDSISETDAPTGG
jgi:hypothetical protein